MYQLFDEKIQDSTMIVALIGLMIVATGLLAHNSVDVRASVLQSQNWVLSLVHDEENIVTIDGKKYQIIFQEIPK